MRCLLCTAALLQISRKQFSQGEPFDKTEAKTEAKTETKTKTKTKIKTKTKSLGRK